MNNDLISREALRKAFHERIYYFDKSSWDEANALIDNAPTVEPEIYINSKDYDLYMEGYKQGKKDFDRPQGEWLTHRVAFHLTCPFCGCNLRALKSEVFEGDYDYNFCPNCGANLRKPNCVRCDHFGKCDGCEKGEEE